MPSKHSRNDLEKKFLSGKIPVALDETTYERFSDRNTIFARVSWDQSFPAYQRRISERESQKVGTPGYSHVAYAARSAAWTIYDNFREAFAWNRIGEQEQKGPTEVTTELPKYEPANPEEGAKIVKKVAQIYGAADVGICELDPDLNFVYTHNRQDEPIQFPEGVKYAIVMAIKMDFDGIATSPALPASIATGHGYSQMAFTIACLAEFLRNLGYTAIPAGNDLGLSVPLAIQAGLGEVGRNGLLIHPKFGQRVRICKVFTDFPMAIDKPIHFGAVRLCRVCKKCAKHCPSNSISRGEPTWESPWNSISNNNGAFKWYVNVESCYRYWVRNSSDCSNCIRACPFTKPPGFSHDIARFFIKYFPFLNRFWVLLDDIMGKIPIWQYGKQKNPEKFWKSKDYLKK
ncbi:MAG: reductive dehalogenase [Candidatus Thorarchaeota archaeon]